MSKDPARTSLGTCIMSTSKTTAWTGFAEHMEAIYGSAPTGHGNSADFEAMLEAALAKEAGEAASKDEEKEKEQIHEMPVQFEPLDIVTASEDDSLFVKAYISSAPPPGERPERRYRLTCGLLIQVRHANLRMAGRNIYAGATLADKELAANNRYFAQISHFCCKEDRGVLEAYSGEGVLHELVLELVSKKMILSKKLVKVFEAEPLPLRDEHTGLLKFRASFVTALEEYFHRVEKPVSEGEGAGVGRERWFPEMDSLMAIGREECDGCHLMRGLYCANCGGRRTREAEKVLPRRISKAEMPFDILMVLHYQETWNRSTGAHASALIDDGVLTVVHWEQLEEGQGGERRGIVDQIDPQRDVLLFPSSQAVTIGDSGLWSPSSATSAPSARPKPRLVVLEANWSYAKSMAGWLTAQMPTLKHVCLADVTGTYWRFQDEGASALSTIEALYHSACQATQAMTAPAGAEMREREAPFHNLLLLFEYQRKRMLAAKEKEGKGGVPLGLVPTGYGLHAWGPYLRGRSSQNIL